MSASSVGPKRQPVWRSKEPRRFALLGQKGNGVFVKGYENVAAQPVSFIGNDAISEIAVRFQHRQACFHRGPVHLNIGCRKQRTDRCRNVFGIEAVADKVR